MSKSRASVLTVLLLLMFSCSPSLRAAGDMFLDITGIPGESTDPSHTNQVDVLGWSWGMINGGSAQTGVSTNKASFQSLNVTKYVDKASPRLMLACAKGTHISMATLYVRNTDTNPIEFIKIRLTNVLVTTVLTGGSGGEDQLTENVSLSFANVQLDYIPVKPDVDAGTPFSFRWDIPSNSGTVISPVHGLTSTLTYANGAPAARLTWSSIAGVNYQVWFTGDLKTAFQRYGAATASAGDGTTSVLVPANAIRMFFRIETLSGP
jgi:type VI secretion system secreted protein Hcp